MDDKDSKPSKLADFYYIAEDYGQVGEKEISPSLHAVSQISERYTSREFIAKGGMKQVYKVYDARCKRDVAMATLHDDAPLELCDPLIHEAWLTALLDHPNIITIHDVGVDSRKRPFFTMDLKCGDSLGEVIEKLRAGSQKVNHNDSLESLLQIFVKICDAMAYAHSIQVLHLDLKPANIQVGDYGEVLVCDWGLGRVQKGKDGIEFERLLLNSDLLSSNTLFGEVRGTPGYMAPEQIEQDQNRDTRTDIYQLGCILYSILTLQCPVERQPQRDSETPLHREIAPPRQRAPERHIPASLEAVALKAMASNPDSRYQSVETLGDEVRRYLTGFATNAEEAGVLTQLTLLYKRNKRFCLTVVCSALVMFLGAIWSYWKLADKERDARSALERAVVEMHLSANAITPKELLDEALESQPDSPTLLRAMGEHYFILQRFNQAVPYLDAGEKREEWPDQLICDLARKYAELKPNEDDKLTTDQMVDLLRSIEGFNGFEAMVLLNDQNNRVDPRERAVVIQEHLRSLNPEWRDGWFEYNFKESRLRVGGKGLKRLSESGDILAGLQPKHLDISDSEVRTLWEEADNGIETLDLRGCILDEPNVLQRFVHLRELIISPGQQELEKHLPDWVKVTVQE